MIISFTCGAHVNAKELIATVIANAQHSMDKLVNKLVYSEMIEDPQGGDHRRPTLLFSAVVVEFLTLGVLGVLGVCVFKCGILAIRGRRSMTRQLLIFLGASARPTWKRSLEGFLE